MIAFSGSNLYTIKDLTPYLNYFIFITNHHTISRSGPPVIGSSSWRLFWHNKISPFARRTTLSTELGLRGLKSHARLVIPDFIAACPFCAASPEHTPHMALYCPSKLGVWSRVWAHYFPQESFEPDDVWHFLTTLRPTTPLPRHRLLLLFQVAGSTLQVIWRSHWASPFRDVPFCGLFGQVVEELSRIRLLCAPVSKVGEAVSTLPSYTLRPLSPFLYLPCFFFFLFFLFFPPSPTYSLFPPTLHGLPILSHSPLYGLPLILT
ncbi:hypothetical protein [Absidia glauca]|uniref:Reverse transcriptase zinc-binding domain-containing protein n=1 Tax=Absidia glauca TaxID=4829 RepID=A0A168S8U1_ABSGL|nr:hypothetical protein [Absidia glauca]